MKAVIQRVKSATVEMVTPGGPGNHHGIKHRIHSHINRGMLVLVGIEKGDTLNQAEILARKITYLRIFEDNQHKMNLTLGQIKGDLLVVSQFTLGADLSRGNRPSFDKTAPATEAEPIYQHFINELSKCLNQTVHTGVFGARMLVTSQNDGPVTFIL